MRAGHLPNEISLLVTFGDRHHLLDPGYDVEDRIAGFERRTVQRSERVIQRLLDVLAALVYALFNAGATWLEVYSDEVADDSEPSRIIRRESTNTQDGRGGDSS